MTSTTSTTSMEIRDHERGHIHSATELHRDSHHSTAGTTLDTTSSGDSVLEASRIADAAVPDGGHGWVVLGGCAVIAWWYTGTSYSWGVVQAALVEEGVSSASTLSFVGSLAPTLISALAVVNGRLMRRLGARWTGVIGVSLLGLADLLASFAVHNVAGLFATCGVLLGIGMSMCFMVCSVTPAQYFSRKRGLANGIVYAGGGLGGAVVSLALDALITRYGTAWTYRIMCFVTLATGLPASWLVKERNPIHSRAFVEWRLFRSASFLLIFAAGAVATFPIFVPPFFLPIYSHSLSLSSSVGAALVAGFNFSSAVGRIVCGLFSDRLGPLNTLCASLVLTALSMLALWPASTTLGPLAAFTVINGMSNGGFFATMPTVVGNVFGSARVAVAMGMVVTSWGAGYLLGAPIAGYMLDAYGGDDAGLEAYRPAMYYAGSMALGAAGMVAVVRFRMNNSPWAKV